MSQHHGHQQQQQVRMQTSESQLPVHLPMSSTYQSIAKHQPVFHYATCYASSPVDFSGRPSSALYELAAPGCQLQQQQQPLLPGSAKPEQLAWARLGPGGGRVCLAETGERLFDCPAACLTASSEIFLTVCPDPSDRPPVMSDRQTLLSPVVTCGAAAGSSRLARPVVLTLPHAACLRQGFWNVALRLAAFAAPLSLSASSDFSLRLHVLRDTPDALDQVVASERQAGARLIDAPRQLAFRDCGEKLCLSIEELSLGWRSKCKHQEVPFGHVWSSHQAGGLHCGFSLEHVDPTRQSVSCKIVIYQSRYYNCRQVVHIVSSKNDLPCVNHEGSPACPTSAMLDPSRLGLHVDPTPTVFRLPPRLRRAACQLLDAPSPRGGGHDWLTLSRMMGIERCVNYFACQNSQIANIGCGVDSSDSVNVSAIEGRGHLGQLAVSKKLLAATAAAVASSPLLSCSSLTRNSLSRRSEPKISTDRTADHSRMAAAPTSCQRRFMPDRLPGLTRMPSPLRKNATKNDADKAAAGVHADSFERIVAANSADYFLPANPPLMVLSSDQVPKRSFWMAMVKNAELLPLKTTMAACEPPLNAKKPKNKMKPPRETSGTEWPRISRGNPVVGSNRPKRGRRMMRQPGQRHGESVQCLTRDQSRINQVPTNSQRSATAPLTMVAAVAANIKLNSTCEYFSGGKRLKAQYLSPQNLLPGSGLSSAKPHCIKYTTMAILRDAEARRDERHGLAQSGAKQQRWLRLSRSRLSQVQECPNILIKECAGLLHRALAYYIFGYALGYGDPSNGFCGERYWALSGLPSANYSHVLF
uniref:Netrin receptor UNC5 n=1 Tax=Macrostomum lignano TaxID=282301 RepID=A0A1I8F222_9PLAT